ncbi:trypsin-like serine peptidase [Sorangium sp. So ce131]|uniref:trypsin-like serine peptidase n=1 Tax=Sorangium sp. So ce131 TaxID=3133282 RepID=UPI003F6463C3
MRMQFGTRKSLHRSMAAASLLGMATLAVVGCSDAPAHVQPGSGGSDPLPSTEPPPPPAEAETPPAEAELVSGQDPKNAYLRAVGTLGSTCTGSLIKTSDKADAPAYVLTAGHCAKGPFSDSMYFGVSVDELTEGGLNITFNYFNDLPYQEQVSARALRTAYVTMKGADLALIELDHTIGELQALGVEPLPVADAAPAPGEPIELAGVPVEHDGGAYSGRYVRRARCAEGARRPDVVEHYWYWHDMHVNECQGMGPGASGGPALDQRGRVFGVFNTHFTTIKPPDTCYLNYPCEVGDGEPERGVEGASYVVDATTLTSCFDAEGRFDLATAGCKLAPALDAPVNYAPSRIVTPTQGDPPEPSVWDVSLASTPHTHYRYKVGPAQSVDCRSAEGYSDPIGIEDDRLARLPVPAEEGLYAMCILTGSGDVGGATWQSKDHPTVIVKKVRNVREVASGADAADVTTEQAFDLAHRAVDVYQGHAKEHGARLLVNYGSKFGTQIDIQADRDWELDLGVTFRKQGVTPPDIAAFMACHEIGHALGGFPFKRTPVQQAQVEGLATGQFGTVSSAEGQADYFASKECLPRLWAAEREVNASFRAAVTDYAKERCDAAWEDADAQNLCYRIAAVAEAFGVWKRGTDVEEASNPIPRLDTPSTVEAQVTDYENMPAQCRVDTIFQGALCGHKFRGTDIPGLIPPYEQVLTFSPDVEAAAAPDSCTEGPGARPRCWFMPNSTKPDCTGIPETGMCDVIDGQSAQVTCGESTGIQTYICLPGSTCQVDEDGWAFCQ